MVVYANYMFSEVCTSIEIISAGFYSYISKWEFVYLFIFLFVFDHVSFDIRFCDIKRGKLVFIIVVILSHLALC